MNDITGDQGLVNFLMHSPLLGIAPRSFVGKVGLFQTGSFVLHSQASVVAHKIADG